MLKIFIILALYSLSLVALFMGQVYITIFVGAIATSLLCVLNPKKTYEILKQDHIKDREFRNKKYYKRQYNIKSITIRSMNTWDDDFISNEEIEMMESVDHVEDD